MNTLLNEFLYLVLSTPTLPIRALQITVYAIKGYFFGLNDIANARYISYGDNSLSLCVKKGL
jgi:hypothetical protein